MIKDYKDLCIGKYLEIQEIAKDNTADIDKQVNIIAVLADMTEDEVLDLPLVEYKTLAEQSKFLEIPMQVPTNVAKCYKINGWELIPSFDIYKLTTAQYIDFQNFSKLGENQLVNVLSCFMIPKGKKYNEDYDIIEVQNTIREYLSAPDCFALAAFFLNELKMSMQAMLIYCRMAVKMMRKEKKKEMLKQIETLQKIQDNLPSGNGLVALML